MYTNVLGVEDHSLVEQYFFLIYHRIFLLSPVYLSTPSAPLGVFKGTGELRSQAHQLPNTLSFAPLSTANTQFRRVQGSTSVDTQLPFVSCLLHTVRQ